MSFISNDDIYTDGFSLAVNLKYLDTRGTLIRHYPTVNLYSNSSSIREIYSSNYQFCCERLLPGEFNVDNCVSKTHDISICEHLLGSKVFKVYVWIQALFTFPNVMFVVYIIHSTFIIKTEKSESTKPLSLLFPCLLISNITTNIYHMVLAFKDLAVQGRFLYNEQDWKKSIVCKILLI